MPIWDIKTLIFASWSFRLYLVQCPYPDSYSWSKKLLLNIHCFVIERHLMSCIEQSIVKVNHSLTPTDLWFLACCLGNACLHVINYNQFATWLIDDSLVTACTLSSVTAQSTMVKANLLAKIKIGVCLNHFESDNVWTPSLKKLGP